jgi:hypothetical protein
MNVWEMGNVFSFIKKKTHCLVAKVKERNVSSGQKYD